MTNYLLKGIDPKTYHLFKLCLTITRETAKDVLLRAIRVYVDANAYKLPEDYWNEWKEIKNGL